MSCSRMKHLSKAAFWGVSFTAVYLLWRAFSYILDAEKSSESFFLIGLILVFLYAVSREYKDVSKESFIFLNRNDKIRNCVVNIVIVLLGTFLSFWLNHAVGLGGVVASSVVGAAAGVFFPRYAAPVYCGSFLGMACNVIFSHPLHLLSAGILSGGLYALSENSYQGIGGKLGTIAFFGTCAASMLLNRPLRTVGSAEEEMLLALFIWTMIAGLVTFLVKEYGKLSAVMASSIVGLCLGLVLPRLYPQMGSELSVAAFCATFTGMTSSNRIGGWPGIIIASMLTGTLFVIVYPLFDGSGGKLGTIAFVSSLTVAGMREGFFRLKQKFQASSFS